MPTLSDFSSALEVGFALNLALSLIEGYKGTADQLVDRKISRLVTLLERRRARGKPVVEAEAFLEKARLAQDIASRKTSRKVTLVSGIVGACAFANLILLFLVAYKGDLALWWLPQIIIILLVVAPVPSGILYIYKSVWNEYSQALEYLDEASKSYQTLQG
jgi:hypothetical protein